MKHRVFLIALFALLLPFIGFSQTQEIRARTRWFPFIGFSQTQEVEKDRYAFLYRDNGTVYAVWRGNKRLKELGDQLHNVRTEDGYYYTVIGETGGRDYFAEYKNKYTNSSDLVRLFLTARDIKPNEDKEIIVYDQLKPQWDGVGVELNETKRIPLPALSPEKQVYFGSLYPKYYSKGDPAMASTLDFYKGLTASLRPVDAVKPVLFKNANGLFSVFGDTQVGFHFAPEEDGKIHYLVYPPGNALFLRDYDSEVPPLMQSCGMDPDGYIWVADYDRNIAFFDTGKNMYFWHVAQASSNAVLIPRDNLSRSVFVFNETWNCFVESTFDPKQIVNDTVKGEVRAEQLSFIPDSIRRALPENTMKVLYCDEEQVVFLSGDALQARHRDAAKNRKTPVNVTPDEIVEEGLYDPETQTAFLLIRPITESEKALYRKRIDKKITPAVHRYRPEFRKEFSTGQRHDVKDVTGPEVDPYEVRALWHLNRLETVDLSPVETLPDTSPEATETAFTPDKAGKIMEDLKYADVKLQRDFGGAFAFFGFPRIRLGFRDAERHFRFPFVFNSHTNGLSVEATTLGKDFNGIDICLFNLYGTRGAGSMVMCADGNVDSFDSLAQLDPGDWFVAGCGDYNGDQKDDLLVRQYSTGMLGYYSSGDTSKWVELGRGVDMDWTVIA